MHKTQLGKIGLMHGHLDTQLLKLGQWLCTKLVNVYIKIMYNMCIQME